METQKGSSSFRMRLARVTVDGDDEPIGREASLCLRTQRDQTSLSNNSKQLMDIHIDGRLMACWEFTLLKQHPSYSSIRIFSTYTISKYISMSLPIPSDSDAAPLKNSGSLKVIRLFFTKAQDFHTAIAWLSKQAELICLDGRPATSNGFHTSASTLREKPIRLASRLPMAPPAQPSASQLREKSGSRPHSGNGLLATSQHSGYPQSQFSNLGGQPHGPQYLQRPRSRRQSRDPVHPRAHGVPVQRPQSDLRRNVLATKESDRPATVQSFLGGYRIGDRRASGLQMPRVGSIHRRTMSAASMGIKAQSRYSRPAYETLYASPPLSLDPSPDQHSTNHFHRYPRGVSSPDSGQGAHAAGGQYNPTPSSQPFWEGPSRLLQTKAFASIRTQSTIAADNMDVAMAIPCASVLGDAAQKHRITSMATTGVRMFGASPDQTGPDVRPSTSNQIVHEPNISSTLPRPSLDGPECPPASLFAITAKASQHPPDQNMSFDGASTLHGSAQLQNEIIGPKRPLSAQALQIDRENKRRKSHQLKERSRGRNGRDDDEDDDASERGSIETNKPRTQTSEPTLVAPYLANEPITTTTFPRNGVPMIERAAQTDPPPRLQVDVLHLSAALKLDSKLLQETKQWEDTESVKEGLVILGAHFVQGLYDIFRGS